MMTASEVDIWHPDQYNHHCLPENRGSRHIEVDKLSTCHTKQRYIELFKTIS